MKKVGGSIFLPEGLSEVTVASASYISAQCVGSSTGQSLSMESAAAQAAAATLLISNAIRRHTSRPNFWLFRGLNILPNRP